MSRGAVSRVWAALARVRAAAAAWGRAGGEPGMGYADVRRRQTALDVHRIEQDARWAERAQDDLADMRRRLRAEGRL